MKLNSQSPLFLLLLFTSVTHAIVLPRGGNKPSPKPKPSGSGGVSGDVLKDARTSGTKIEGLLKHLPAHDKEGVEAVFTKQYKITDEISHNAEEDKFKRKVLADLHITLSAPIHETHINQAYINVFDTRAGIIVGDSNYHA